MFGFQFKGSKPSEQEAFQSLQWQKMLVITVRLFVALSLWDSASSSITCPDGSPCSDLETCCKTPNGYICCPYPKAVCCSDLAHCCPSDYVCDLTTQTCVKQYQPWISLPVVRKTAAKVESSPDLTLSSTEEEAENHVLPEQIGSSVVHCDNYYACPDGTTCCRHPKGGFLCCPYSPARCCLDGFHCCPYGYDCDYSYTHCVRTGLEDLFAQQQALTSLPASLVSMSEDRASREEKPMTALTEARVSDFNQGVVRCDDTFYCQNGSSCCKGPEEKWNCCPYPLGVCCADGRHCCEYGCHCNLSSSECTTKYS